MAAEYEFSQRVKDVAEGLVKIHHIHLATAKIAYLMKKVEYDSKGRVKSLTTGRMGKRRAMAKVKTAPADWNCLTGFDFVMTVEEYFWDILTLEQQIALVDHELCHCARDGDGFYTKDHDVEEFIAVVERHGFWRNELKLMSEALQMKLPFEQAKESQPVSVQ